MIAAKWAPDNDQGQHAYLRSEHSWGHTYTRVVYASTLAEAKRKHGWTRQLHVSITMRRARAEDVQS